MSISKKHQIEIPSLNNYFLQSIKLAKKVFNGNENSKKNDNQKCSRKIINCHRLFLLPLALIGSTTLNWSCIIFKSYEGDLSISITLVVAYFKPHSFDRWKKIVRPLNEFMRQQMYILLKQLGGWPRWTKRINSRSACTWVQLFLILFKRIHTNPER